MSGGIPQPLRVVGSAAALLFGGMFTLSLASSAAIRTLQAASEAKRRRLAPPCMVCKGIGFYSCKLCRGNSTIEWSPLYDPIVINLCLCPTCDGNRLVLFSLLVALKIFVEGKFINRVNENLSYVSYAICFYGRALSDSQLNTKASIFSTGFEDSVLYMRMKCFCKCHELRSGSFCDVRPSQPFHMELDRQKANLSSCSMWRAG